MAFGLDFVVVVVVILFNVKLVFLNLGRYMVQESFSRHIQLCLIYMQCYIKV